MSRTDNRIGAIWLAALAAIGLGAGPGRGPEVASVPGQVRLTVDLVRARSAPGAIPGRWSLRVEGTGQVRSARAWDTPGAAARSEPARMLASAAGDGGWDLGPDDVGLVRARIEAHPNDRVRVVKLGAGERPEVDWSATVRDLIDGPRDWDERGIRGSLGRVAWDAIEVARLDRPESPSAPVAPGGVLPLDVGLNLLSPEASEVGVTLSVAIRPAAGGEPVRRDERHLIAPTNARTPSRLKWNLEVPTTPGAYVLEWKAQWEVLVGREGSLLGRWLARRRARDVETAATRRLGLWVSDPGSDGGRPTLPAGEPGRAVVDSLDLARPRGRAIASGSTPGSAGFNPWPVPADALELGLERRRELFRDILPINRGGAATLALAGPRGNSWVAAPLTVARPGRPHLLTLRIAEGDPSAVSVGLFAGSPPRRLLDAVPAGPAVASGGPPAVTSWVVWPDDPRPVLVLMHRGPVGPARVAGVELAELSHLPPLILDPGPGKGGRRHFLVDLAAPAALDRFGGGPEGDELRRAINVAEYLDHVGAEGVVLPGPVAARGDEAEDAFAAAPGERVRERLKAWGFAVWSGLEPPPGARSGDPLRPEVRGAWKESARSAAGGPVDGLVWRPDRRALLAMGEGESVPDDATYRRFAASAFDAMASAEVPGLAEEGPRVREARRAFLEGPGRLPWLSWRSREVAGFARWAVSEVRAVEPSATLAVLTPEPGRATLGRAIGRAVASGAPPAAAWREAALDWTLWEGQGAPANEATGLLPLRAIGRRGETPSTDLPAAGDLDEPLARLPVRGAMIDADSPVPAWTADGRPTLGALAGPARGEPGFSHALAALDAGVVVLAADGLDGREEKLREVVRLFRGLPRVDGPAGPPAPGVDRGYLARTVPDGGTTGLLLVNNSPQPVLLETRIDRAEGATVEDRRRGYRLAPEMVAERLRVVIALGPFELSALRIGAEKAGLAEVTAHPPTAVKAQLRLQAEALSSRLEGLQRAEAAAPEDVAAELGLIREVRLDGPVGEEGGWRASGATGNAVRADRAREGEGASLRLDAAILPTSASSPTVAMPSGRVLTLSAWLRADAAELPVRVWLEGEAEGKPFARSVEVQAATKWAPVAARFSELPDAGLEQVRVRLEPLRPGRLWADEVTLTARGMGRDEARQARRALISALQAYRDGRIGDFTRMVESRRLRALLAEPSAIALPDPAGIR